MTVVLGIEACEGQFTLHSHPDCSKDALISLLTAAGLCVLHLQAFDNL